MALLPFVVREEDGEGEGTGKAAVSPSGSTAPSLDVANLSQTSSLRVQTVATQHVLGGLLVPQLVHLGSSLRGQPQLSTSLALSASGHSPTFSLTDLARALGITEAPCSEGEVPVAPCTDGDGSEANNWSVEPCTPGCPACVVPPPSPIEGHETPNVA